MDWPAHSDEQRRPGTDVAWWVRTQSTIEVPYDTQPLINGHGGRDSHLAASH